VADISLLSISVSKLSNSRYPQPALKVDYSEDSLSARSSISRKSVLRKTKMVQELSPED
jgi:hypothetical protein